MKITEQWNNQTRKLYDERNEQIFQMWANGVKYKDIAAKYGLTITRIGDILKKKRDEKGWYQGKGGSDNG